MISDARLSVPVPDSPTIGIIHAFSAESESDEQHSDDAFLDPWTEHNIVEGSPTNLPRVPSPEQLNAGFGKTRGNREGSEATLVGRATTSKANKRLNILDVEQPRRLAEDPLEYEDIEPPINILREKSLKRRSGINSTSLLTRNGRPRSNSESTQSDSAWTACAEIVWQHEEDTVKKWNTEIDALLVFAGLFSAALTAFNVQYSMANNPGPSGASGSGSNNSTSTQPHQIPSDIINASWYSALVFSLAAASIAISVKQWLNQFTSRVTSMPRQSVIVWFSRRRGFNRWRVEDIINLLPVLLQIALILFLIGLIELVWTLSPPSSAVASIVTVLSGALLLFLACTAVIPAIAADCPYRSPQAWWIAVVIQSLKSRLGVGRRSVNWEESERDFVTLRNHEFVDSALLVAADAAVMDHDFLKEVIQLHVATASLEDAAEILSGILQNRVHGIADEKLAWNIDKQALATIARMTFDVLYKAVDGPHVQISFPFAKPVRCPSKLLGVLDKLVAAMSTDPRAAVFIRLLDFLKSVGDKFALDTCDRLTEITLIHAHRFLRFDSQEVDVYHSLFELLQTMGDRISPTLRTRLLHIVLDKPDWLKALIQDDDSSKSRLRTLTAFIPRAREDRDVATFVRVTVMLMVISRDLSVLAGARIRRDLHLALAKLQDEPTGVPITISASTEPEPDEAEVLEDEVKPIDILKQCLRIAEKHASASQKKGFIMWKNLIAQMRGGERLSSDTVINHAAELFLTQSDAYDLWLIL